jgi:hypothetical protein
VSRPLHLDIWLAVLWLVAAFALMLLVHRWLEAHLQGLAYLITGHPTVAMWLFFIIFLPGTLVHELSHWAMAKLLAVPTGRIELWPRAQKSGAVWLGSVQVGRADPFRSSLIGLAPLVTGSLLSALIGAHLELNTLGSALSSGEWQVVWLRVGQSATLPDFWLWVYLLFAIANRMLPSPSDRQAWLPVIIFLALTSAMTVVSGWSPDISPDASTMLRDVVGFLLYAFALIVAVDILVALVVAVLEIITGLIRRQRIEY